MMVYEDLFFIDDNKLLVSAGDCYTKLKYIFECPYRFQNDTIVLDVDNKKILVEDDYPRLGNLIGNRLVYSTRSKGVVNSTIQINSKKAHQPFEINGKTYYSDLVGGSKLANAICCDNEIVLTAWDDYEEICNPFFINDVEFLFEARRKQNVAPSGWEILKYNLNTKDITTICSAGANPSVYKNKLVYCFWTWLDPNQKCCGGNFTFKTMDLVA